MFSFRNARNSSEQKKGFFFTACAMGFHSVSHRNSTSDAEHTEGRKLATDRPGFISIDCGAAEDYLDEESGIYYKSDSGFITTGENKEVQPEYAASHPQFGRMLKNLRSFPQGRKNCYNLKPEQGKDNHYLIRIYNQYGNYDARNQAPKYDLYIGVNYLLTIDLRDAVASTWYFTEGMFFSTVDTIHVCLVNTGSGVPVISGLELRVIDNAIYQTDSNVYASLGRFDAINGSFLGDRSKTVRYKDDVYDRIWSIKEFPNPGSTSELDWSGSNDTYRLPDEVLRTAAQPLLGSGSLKYTLNLANDGTDTYVYFHFAEIEKTAKSKPRAFSITLNGVKYEPITLEYLKPVTIRPQTSPIRGYINFSIDATPESELPPILNAFEIYMVVTAPVSPTDPADIDAIMEIKEKYKISRDDWQGDPCLPRDYTWNGLNCSYDSSPRIIALNLRSSNLEGEIDSSLFNLKAIESMDLSYNLLTGPVPEFLAQLPKLKILNLSANKLTGPIPQVLKEKSENGTLWLSLAENPNLCLTDTCENKSKTTVLPIVASAVSVVALLIFLSVLLIICRIKRRRQKGNLIIKSKSIFQCLCLS
ncbi:hypothetical protein SLEP1_g14449 [Rubroshorea leprosula]|uniref:Malectin-like domain-containing protein n=1 Tax=Rubroshorea leprosula TaxID=152421 RepID=A0AAV5IVM4_9ROSI|nr:hypothetical protein SLEP1_g14449 [Rubroshorea leprosula]